MLDTFKPNSIVIGISLLILLLMIYSCSKKQSEVVSDSPTTAQSIETAQNELGPDSDVMPNETRSFFLCLLTRKPMTTFAVVDVHGHVVLDQQKVRGKVSWHTATSIQVQEQPGVIEDKNSKPSDYVRIIELNHSH